jgi:ParB family transcriptional regulator, chromosome partitioning protein
MRELSVAHLEPDPFQPRQEFDEESIRELAASIEQHGLLQPLLVRPRQGPGSEARYWIVAGERRWRAAQLLGLTQVPCRVQPLEDLAAAVVALVENVHREDLSEIEKAEGLQRLKQLTGKSWDEVAGLVRLSHAYVRRLAGLVKLEEEVKELVRRGKISARTAIALKPLLPAEQIELAHRAVAEGLSAEAIRQISRSGLPSAGQKRGAPSRSETLDAFIAALEQMGAWLAAQHGSSRRFSLAEQERIERLGERARQLQQLASRLR